MFKRDVAFPLRFKEINISRELILNNKLSEHIRQTKTKCILATYIEIFIPCDVCVSIFFTINDIKHNSPSLLFIH